MKKKAIKKAGRVQPTPAVVVLALLRLIKGKFYQGAAVNFYKERKLLLRWVVLWPAAWLNKRGVTLPVERYQEIVTGVIMDAAAHGTETIKFRPAYLGKVIESHFAVHGDEYHAEGKSIAKLADQALVTALATGKALPVAAADPVKEMTNARDMLTAEAKERKAAKKVAGKGQLMMF